MTDITKMPDDQVKAIDLVTRFEIISNIGMLADEDRIGQPEKPFKDWSDNDFATVLKLFETWPDKELCADKFDQLATQFAQKFDKSLLSGSDMKALLAHTAQTYTTAARDVFGDDVPHIELMFKSSPHRPGYYAGLIFEGPIEVNASNLTQASVKGSDFNGNASFVELICHEATHSLQRHLAETSDGQTQDIRLSSRILEMFYEAAQGAKEFGRRDLYWQHPMEVQARDVASLMTKTLMQDIKQTPQFLNETPDTHDPGL